MEAGVSDLCVLGGEALAKLNAVVTLSYEELNLEVFIPPAAVD